MAGLGVTTERCRFGFAGFIRFDQGFMRFFALVGRFIVFGDGLLLFRFGLCSGFCRFGYCLLFCGGFSGRFGFFFTLFRRFSGSFNFFFALFCSCGRFSCRFFARAGGGFTGMGGGFCRCRYHALPDQQTGDQDDFFHILGMSVRVDVCCGNPNGK